MTKNIAMIVINLVTRKGVAKQELLLNKLASEGGLLNIQVRLKKHNKM